VSEMYVRLPDALHKDIRHVAADEETSVNKCVIRLLEEALEERRVSVPSRQYTAQQRPGQCHSENHPATPLSL